MCGEMYEWLKTHMKEMFEKREKTKRKRVLIKLDIAKDKIQAIQIGICL